MYLQYFKFNAKPFALNPDPAFLYASDQHSKALTMLEYAIESQAAFCMLTGEIGSGKTTILRHLIRNFDSKITVGLISNCHQGFRSIHPWALSALGLMPRDTSEVAQYETLTAFIIAEYGKGRRTLLILDEAQNLSIATLEELRLLSNVNSENDVALQTLLVGQPELRNHIMRPELHQFAQRIAVDFHLKPLTLLETECYVRHRLTVAGGSEAIFQQSAIRSIHKLARGIPRVINQLCDLCLVYAFADRQQRVDATMVIEILQDRVAGRASGRPVARGEAVAAKAPTPLGQSELPLGQDGATRPERA